MVKSLCFQCRGHSIPGQGTNIPHATWCGQTLSAGKIENGLEDTVREGENGTSGESSIDIYILSCIKKMSGENTAVEHREPRLALYVDLKGWDAGRL